ncbi:MAG: cell division protein FtsL [Nitrospirae bacterium]|nr:cell division protein FtsL [Nitrospirota bacterium]
MAESHTIRTHNEQTLAEPWLLETLSADRQGGVRRWLPLLLGLLLLGGTLLHVWQRVQVIRLGYALEEIQGRKQALLRGNKTLQVEAATLSTLDRVERIALREVGLQPLDRSRIVVLRQDPSPVRGGRW